MHRVKGLLRSSRSGTSAQGPPDEAAGVKQLASLVSPDTIAAYAGTSELPSGPAAPAEVEQLLGRYWRAEKGSVEKAAKRLEQQAAWHRGFGVVTQVRAAQGTRFVYQHEIYAAGQASCTQPPRLWPVPTQGRSTGGPAAVAAPVRPAYKSSTAVC